MVDAYDRLDTALKVKGISRRKAAIIAGIPPSTLNTAITRKKGLSLGALDALADALNLPGVFLLHGVIPTGANLQDLDKINNALLEKSNRELSGDGPYDKYATYKHAHRLERKEKLNASLDLLNDEGQEEAVKRVNELAELSRYKRED